MSNDQTTKPQETLTDSCPIFDLFGSPMSELTDEQLNQYTQKVRAARETPAILNTLLKGTVKAEKKGASKKTARSMMKMLGL